MRTKQDKPHFPGHRSLPADTGAEAYESPQAKLLSLSLERAILNDSDGTTSDLGEGGQHF